MGGGGGGLYTVYGLRLRTCGVGQQGIQLHVCAGRSLIFVVIAPLAYVAAVTRHDPYLVSCCVWHSGLSSSDSVGNAGVKVRLPSTTQATRLQVGTVGLSWTTLK